MSPFLPIQRQQRLSHNNPGIPPKSGKHERSTPPLNTTTMDFIPYTGPPPPRPKLAPKGSEKEREMNKTKQAVHRARKAGEYNGAYEGGMFANIHQHNYQSRSIHPSALHSRLRRLHTPSISFQNSANYLITLYQNGASTIHFTTLMSLRFSPLPPTPPSLITLSSSWILSTPIGGTLGVSGSFPL